MMKRRLSSKGGSTSLLLLDDDIEEVEVDHLAAVHGHYRSKNRSSINSRRSSLLEAGKPALIKNENQSKIADMYKVVIKLSAENKLNEKNAWNYDLIDHMGSIIKQESQGNRGVNFQKASCTLDASVKIYANRVDDTYAISHRILENLSRQGNDEETGDSSEVKKVARVGTKTSSNKLNIATTIEKDYEKLNSSKIEKENTIDPTFQKMSLAFDEGGAKGMLLYNLRLDPNECSLLFGEYPFRSTDKLSSNPLACTSLGSGTMSFDLVKSKEMVPLPNDVRVVVDAESVCPELDQYRQKLNSSNDSSLLEFNFCLYWSSSGIQDRALSRSRVGIMPVGSVTDELLKDFEIARSSKNSSILDRSTPTQSVTTSSFDSQTNELFFDDIDYNQADHNDCCDDDQDLDVDVKESIKNRLSVCNEANAETAKINWEVVFGGNNDTSKSETSQGQTSVNIDEWQYVSMVQNDYAFVDVKLGVKNAWVGAKHWKYAAKQVDRPPTESAIDERRQNDLTSSDASITKSRKTKEKKGKFSIDFNSFDLNTIDRSLFATHTGKSKSDSTQLSTTTLEKLEFSSSDLYLPLDAKRTIRDLCRLYNIPSMMMPSKNPHIRLQDIAPNSSSKNYSKDVTWGATRRSSVVLPPITDSNDFYNDDIQDNDFEDHPSPAEGVVDLTPMHADGLIQANRTVEKIKVAYATSATQVNVRKLKTNIWNYLEEGLGRSEDVENVVVNGPIKNSKEKRTTNELSFRDMIQDLQGIQTQRDASLSFYFICLLHLANEKVLKISNSENGDMSDLRICLDKSLIK